MVGALGRAMIQKIGLKIIGEGGAQRNEAEIRPSMHRWKFECLLINFLSSSLLLLSNCAFPTSPYLSTSLTLLGCQQTQIPHVVSGKTPPGGSSRFL